MTAENKDLMNRFTEEVINQKRLDTAEEIVAEDFVELEPLPGQEQGREGLKQILAAFFAGFPDLSWVTEEQIAEGDKVVSRFRWHGTHEGEFLGIPATGRQIAVKGVAIDRVVDGKFAESWILMDTLGMMQQLGVIPSPEQQTQEA